MTASSAKSRDRRSLLQGVPAARRTRMTVQASAIIVLAVSSARVAAEETRDRASRLVPAAEARSGDAYALQQSSGDRCVWRLGTTEVALALELAGGRWSVASFRNGAVGQEYCCKGGAADFRIAVDDAVWTGEQGGWTLRWSETDKLPQGEIQLKVCLEREELRIERTYVVYPGAGVVRQWGELINAGSRPRKLGDVGFLAMALAPGGSSQGLRFGSFTGGRAADETQRLILQRIDERLDARFESTAGRQHLPWMIVWNEDERHGAFWGWDYLGSWRAEVNSAQGRCLKASLGTSGYSRRLAPGESVHLPAAFLGAFAGDLDDMGNRVLDWQYQYFWRHKNPRYWAQPRFAVDWLSPWVGPGGTADNWSHRLVLDLYFIELARYAGAGVLWDDAGWYDQWGSWNGPDFSQTKAYLEKQGMAHVVWMPTFLRSPGSDVDRKHPQLVMNPKTLWIDQSSAAATEHQLGLLDQKVAQWGGFEWRYDGALGQGRDPLEADCQFRRAVELFLQRHPGLSIDACSGGGSWMGVGLASFASAGEMTDGGVRDHSGYWTSLFLPPDLLHNCIDFGFRQQRKSYDARTDRIHLRMDPNWYGDPGSAAPFQCMAPNTDYRAGALLGPRPESIAHLEQIRRDWDLYKHLKSQGVVGRWAHVFRPRVEGDLPVHYFQRMERSGRRGVILTTRSLDDPAKMPQGAVTVFPKGLQPAARYDVRFDFDKRVVQANGAALMRDGIVIEQLQPGEIVFLNLAHHPGSRTDRTPPSPPSGVTQRLATNIFWQGVEVRWRAGSDEQWLSGYDVFRVEPDGEEVNLGRVSTGTYFFDRSKPADQLARSRYEVRSVDGDGNVSARVPAEPAPGEPRVFYSFEGYGPTSPYRGWSFEKTEDGKSFSPLIWSEEMGREGLWTVEAAGKPRGKDKPPLSGAIGRTWMVPHCRWDLARVLTVDRPGPAAVEGTVVKDRPAGIRPASDSGVKILLNDRQLWPDGGWQVVPLDRTGLRYSVRLDVKPGDRIVHLVRRNGAGEAAGIGWNAAVRHEAPAP